MAQPTTLAAGDPAGRAAAGLDLAVTDVLEGAAARSGLTFADYLVLGVIRRSPGGRSAPTAIAGVLGRTTGGMTLTLDRLEDAGLLRRRRSPDDGRRVIVDLTARGARLATEVNVALHEWESALALPGPAAEVVAMLDALAVAVRTPLEEP